MFTKGPSYRHLSAENHVRLIGLTIYFVEKEAYFSAFFPLVDGHVFTAACSLVVEVASAFILTASLIRVSNKYLPNRVDCISHTHPVSANVSQTKKSFVSIFLHN